jgi:hypothetical protein
MIFLQIASYRDKELNSTIQSALSKAKYPNNINFGIVEQCASNDPLPDLPSKCEYVRTIKDFGQLWLDANNGDLKIFTSQSTWNVIKTVPGIME